MGGTLKNDQQQQNHALEGTEFHLHRFILSMRAAKAVVILHKCADSSEPLLLANAVNTKVSRAVP